MVKIIALFPLLCDKISHIYLLLSGSRPVEGSSKKIMCGFPIKEIATESLLLIPPDKDFANLFLKLNNLTSFSTVSIW